MSRQFNTVDRTSKKLQPNKFFYIACEGHMTETHYFKSLNKVGELCKFIHFQRPEKESTNSAPTNVFATLKKNLKSRGIHPKVDECWIVVDRDAWGSNLEEAVNLCLSNDCKFAVTSPCIELWFIMHLIDVSELIEPLKKILFDNSKIRVTRDRKRVRLNFCELYLEFLMKIKVNPNATYRKSRNLPSYFFDPEVIESAIIQARKIENHLKATDVDYQYPLSEIGSQLYLLIEAFLKFNSDNSSYLK
ncbi:RloB family protein [Acinetobacter courvalinii]|uniref:RloB family protein n=1 Tax=Acinetobacter courvalinii TaxID=280147 RepID=UPI00289679E8|nr:RloB family protein [Acinetobacter courvalinii]